VRAWMVRKDAPADWIVRMRSIVLLEDGQLIGNLNTLNMGGSDKPKVFMNSNLNAHCS
jgi:hypothetical protein